MKQDNKFIKIGLSQFTLSYNTITPKTAFSDRRHEFEPEDLINDPSLAAKAGTYIEHGYEAIFKALEVLLDELDYEESQMNWMACRLGERLSGSLVFDATTWDTGAAEREIRLRIQRWLSACRMVGTVDEIVAETSRRARLDALGKVMGAQWGTHDQYLAHAELINQDYAHRRGVVWVGGLCFEEALAKLDFDITGKSPGRPIDANWSYPKHPEDWYTGDSVLYLADGGYSRLYLGTVVENDRELFAIRLASESRDEVKANWEKPGVVQLAARIEYAMNGWLASVTTPVENP